MRTYENLRYMEATALVQSLHPEGECSILLARQNADGTAYFDNESCQRFTVKLLTRDEVRQFAASDAQP